MEFLVYVIIPLIVTAVSAVLMLVVIKKTPELPDADLQEQLAHVKRALNDCQRTVGEMKPQVEKIREGDPDVQRMLSVVESDFEKVSKNLESFEKSLGLNHQTQLDET